MRGLKVLLPLVAGSLVVVLPLVWLALPHPHDCGGGSFEISNSTSGVPGPLNATYTTLAFGGGVAVSYSWSSSGGTVVTVYLHGPQGEEVGNWTGTAGHGAFTSRSGEYRFGFDPRSAEGTVTFGYGLTCP